MKNILKRLYNIAKAQGLSYINNIGHYSFSGEDEKVNINENWENNEKQSHKPDTHLNSFPHQVVEDLKVFGLNPPSSYEEVKKARNREIKKYHPDKFLYDPEKLNTSKQILQIYNAAYNRLETYFKKSNFKN